MRILQLLLVGIICCFFNTVSLAQKLKRADMTKAPKELVDWLDKGDSCLNNVGEGCAHYYYSALENARQQAAGYYVVTAYCKLGYYYFAIGANDSLLSSVHDGLTISKQRGEDFNTGFLLNLAAAAHINIGHHTDSALHYFLLAKGYFEKIKDTLQIAQNYSNTAGVYVDINDDKTALIYYKKAFELTDKKSTKSLQSIIASNVGECYFRLNELDSAIRYARICLAGAKENNRLDALCTGHQLIATTLVAMKRYDSVAYYASKAIYYGKQLADDQFLADSYNAFATFLLSQKQYKAAFDTSLKSIALNERIQNPKGLSRSYKTAGDAAMMLKDYEHAAVLFQKNFTLMDTLLSDKNITAIRDVNARYETEKKERMLLEKELVIQKKNTQFRLSVSIAILLITGLLLFLFQYRNAQRARLIVIEKERQNAVLKASMNGEERERNRISHELHDGVAAMLGAAKLNIQSIPFLPEEKKAIQLAKVSSILESTHADVRRIAHNLLPVSLEKEGLVAAVQQFSRDINETGILEINVSAQTTGMPALSKQTELMLFRIVQELTNNIIKHAEATKASIGFTYDQTHLQVMVQDNGKGFALSNEGNNQGLYSIRERLKALDGSFDMNSDLGMGANAILRIALPG